MKRSFAFAATSLSAILLVAATLSTAASAQEAGRNIDISKKKFPTLSSITPGADTLEDATTSTTPDAAITEEAAPSGKAQNRISTIDPGQPVDQGGTQDAAADQPELFKSTIEPGETIDTGGFEDARADAPVKPKASTIEPRKDTSGPEIDNNDGEVADVEVPAAPKPKKKLPKVLQPEVDETEETAEVPDPPKVPVAPKKAVDAATSDDVEDEEEIVTKEVEEKPPVETAETEDDEAPTYSKKMQMRYSPSLRRYVQVTDEDIAEEGPEIEDHGYEVPTYRRSYNHGYGQRRNYNYLPSCEN